MAMRRAARILAPSVTLGLKCLRGSASVRVVSAFRHHHCEGNMATWRLDSTVTERYMKLDQGDNVLATYVWIDGTGEVRRKHIAAV